MKMAKRVISLFLTLVVLFSMVPVAVQAEDTQTTMESGSPTIEGTNGFGNLLSQDLQEEQAAQEEDASGGYNVIGLTIEGNVATVEYDSMEEAVLVVALYTEDGLKMLASANTLVDPESTEAIVEFEGELPEYFMASAYLLDTFDYSPLCTSYDTPMYTKEMQELLASTTDDYDADKVLNLDNDNTTNFAVFAEGTKLLEYAEGVNTVISINDDTLTYIIGNADENITGLQVGDVLAYTYGEDEILIVKVAAITVDGTTTTITGADLEMEEVFSHVKMEATGDAGNLTVDDSTGDEGVSYIGKITDEAAVMSLSDPYAASTAASEEDVSGRISLGFKLEKESGSITLKGSLTLDAEVEFSYYISTSRQYVEFKVNVNTALAFEISGEASFPVLKIPSLGFSPVPGVYIGFEPQLVLEFTAKVEASFNVGFTKGFSYENGVGITDLSTRPKIDFAPEIEGSIFFGIDMAPHVSLLNGWLAKFTFSALAGIELKAEMCGTDYEDVQIIGGRQEPESIHSCEACLSVELYGKMEFSIKLDFLKCINLSFKLSDTTFSIGECYYSFDQQDFGWGSCPNKSYRVTVYVQNAQNQDAFGVDVIAGWTEQLTEIPMGATNSNGVVVDYLQTGTYTITAEIDGKKLKKEVEIDESCKVILGGTDSSGKITIKADEVIDYGKATDSGTCGDDVYWTLYSSGLLEIWGNGAMHDYSRLHNYDGDEYAPWYDIAEKIKSVRIENGVTSIGKYAFSYCVSLTSITIPDSVTSIGYGAFYYCVDLPRVTIGNGVTTISGFAFYSCYDLASITISDSVTSIGGGAFEYCTSLISITIPDSVTSIGGGAFEKCTNLTSITIPNSVTSIGDGAFMSCTNLTSVTIPNSVTSIRSKTFAYCSNLTSITIPDSVNSIGDCAFKECKTLTSITIPDSVAIIGSFAFESCWSLTSIIIPDGVTSIGDGAFYRCYRLTNITIPDGITTIGDGTFSYCSLTSITIPDSVASIGEGAFQECTGLTGITIPGSVQTIEKKAFDHCTSLKTIKFIGNRPSIASYAFYKVTATAYYPANNATWTSGTSGNGKITWVPYTTDGNGGIVVIDTETVVAMASEEGEEALNQEEEEYTPALEEELDGGISTFGIWGGEYETEETETYTLKTATFSDLVPGEEYALLALVNTEEENLVDPENLLFIDQGTAGEDGALVFTYVQRVNTGISYVIACGATHNNLKDATITFPEMVASEEVQTVDPTVVFDGKTLVEGVDYTIVGEVDYTEVGTYTCYIRGIYNYSGTVQCAYTVKFARCAGDIDSNGAVDHEDAVYLLLHTMFGGDAYPLNGADADIDGNGVVDQNDVVYLLLHTMFGEAFYPLKKG